MQWWEQILRCPICKSTVSREGGTLFCHGARKHCFDFAGAGYVNLAGARASGGGDDAELIRARTDFLNAGYYAPVARAVCDTLHAHTPNGIVLDAGCGEGYYSLEMARTGNKVIGLDLSKRGILHAAKTAQRVGSEALFSVAGIFDLPIADHSVDAVVSLFAPVCEVEFRRVLKPGGILLLVGAGPDHLYSLKKVLYDTPYQNERRADAPVSMEHLSTQRVAYVADMEQDMLEKLFAMTPYFYRTSREGKARLAATPRLGVDVDVEISLYRNTEKPLS